MGVSQNLGYQFGGPHNKDYSIFGSILGALYFGKLPYSPKPGTAVCTTITSPSHHGIFQSAVSGQSVKRGELQ